MTHEPFFPDSEYASRWSLIRRAIAERNLDALLITSPENIYYLAGLNHQGYFAFTMLILPQDGEALIVARAHEEATIAAQVKLARHIGFGEDDDPSDTVVQALKGARLHAARLGLEKDHMFFPPRVAERIQAALPAADWVDGSGLVEALRLIKSPLELEYTRQAAEISDRAMTAGFEAARAGVNEREVVVATQGAMIGAGGTYPAFVPFIRTNEAIPLGHAAWRDRVLREDDTLFIELAGCVRRYHAPTTRQIYLGRAPARTVQAEPVALEAFQTAVSALRPGAVSGDVYAAWQGVIDRALGRPGPHHPHCGYTLGIGFPPSWVGGSVVVGMRPKGTIAIREGMVVHLITSLNESDVGDYEMSDTVVVTATGCEILTSTPRGVTVR